MLRILGLTGDEQEPALDRPGVALIGVSAGGQLAAMAALDGQLGTSVKAVVAQSSAMRDRLLAAGAPCDGGGEVVEGAAVGILTGGTMCFDTCRPTRLTR